MTNNRFRTYRTNKLDTASGVPTNVDDYVDYINRNYTFAKARVGVDHNGKKYVDLVWNK